MNNRMPVRIVHRLAHRTKQPQLFAHPAPARPAILSERNPLHILHHEVVSILLAETIEDARDMLVAELREHVGLALKRGNCLLLHTWIGEAVDHLSQCARSRCETQILCEVDELHAAFGVKHAFAQHKVAVAAAQLALNKTQVTTAEAGVRAAKAQVEQARLNLSYTGIRASLAGRIASKTVAVGDYVQVGQNLMALVPDQVWVTANFKETELAQMQQRLQAFQGREVANEVVVDGTRSETSTSGREEIAVPRSGPPV